VLVIGSHLITFLVLWGAHNKFKKSIGRDVVEEGNLGSLGGTCPIEKQIKSEYLSLLS